MPDQVDIFCDVVAREGLAIAAQPLRGGEDVGPVAEEADPAVTGGDQMLDRRARPAGVVGHDGVGVDEAWRSVHERQRQPRGALAQQVRVVAHGAGDDQAVDARAP